MCANVFLSINVFFSFAMFGQSCRAVRYDAFPPPSAVENRSSLNPGVNLVVPKLTSDSISVVLFTAGMSFPPLCNIPTTKKKHLSV